MAQQPTIKKLMNVVLLAAALLATHASGQTRVEPQTGTHILVITYSSGCGTATGVIQHEYGNVAACLRAQKSIVQALDKRGSCVEVLTQSCTSKN